MPLKLRDIPLRSKRDSMLTTLTPHTTIAGIINVAVEPSVIGIVAAGLRGHEDDTCIVLSAECSGAEGVIIVHLVDLEVCHYGWEKNEECEGS